MYYRATRVGEKVFYDKFPAIILGFAAILSSLATANVSIYFPSSVAIFYTSLGSTILSALYSGAQMYVSDREVGFSYQEEDGAYVCVPLVRSLPHAPIGRRFIYGEDPNAPRFYLSPQ